MAASRSRGVLQRVRALPTNGEVAEDPGDTRDGEERHKAVWGDADGRNGRAGEIGMNMEKGLVGSINTNQISLEL